MYREMKRVTREKEGDTCRIKGKEKGESHATPSPDVISLHLHPRLLTDHYTTGLRQSMYFAVATSGSILSSASFLALSIVFLVLSLIFLGAGN